MAPGSIKIGTSGWHFEDWVGEFYPHRVAKNRWLEYYAARFPIGEINSTYYRIPTPKSMQGIATRTPEEFRLFAKVHAEVTHHRKEPQTSLHGLLIALEPLRKCEKLLGLLAQFPGGIHYSNENLDYVLELLHFCDGVPLCVEFRHRSWLTDGVFKALRDGRISWVCADEPQLPELMPLKLVRTTEIGYVRLHGRNGNAWYGGGVDRYDYDYSVEELKSFGKSFISFAEEAKHIFVLFNNCHHGQAPRNAWWLQNWLNAISETETPRDTP
jgi:uncharacterized protein YecE (DUF72 family)